MVYYYYKLFIIIIMSYNCVCSLLPGAVLLLISPYCHEVTGLQQTGCCEVRLNSSRLLHEAAEHKLFQGPFHLLN